MTAYTDTGLVTHHAAGEAANLSKETIETLLAEYSFIEDFFAENRLTELHISDNTQLTFDAFLQSLSEEQCEEYAIDREALSHSFFEYIIQMKRFLNGDDAQGIQSLTILPGTNKSGEPENFQDLVLYPSQIISIVGPTGSGKSRLLADIEWTAQKDTPTGRTILINGEVPDKAIRFSINNKLVAQLSQNMNFVMDLSVREFIELHAESRLVENKETAVQRIIEAANKLAGEQFRLDTPITALSGGQSRALMIADTAILSSSPIVLIDEIENAGIDRKKALQLLISNEKIVLMATHDPALALYADKRIVIKNGGINAVIETSDHEKEVLAELESMDAKIQTMRTQLRAGERL
ncbi:ATP-binding cassette domain-containing protein [Treponema vincentii]|uniref:ATP-binding cassette domain-containing protein n=1 Tax=Treponema vincentii TaxID=69710 RepID=UPI0020A2DE76|nr:ATP-binding cassette domain-containing protein [Treponema vincentii]UTC46693.1 ATP-binding cassette domain-containing protein [Treponema vincentii]